jgi:hypothetical protein
MTRPLLLYIGWFSTLVPIAATAAKREQLRGPRLWIVAWLVIMFVSDSLAYYLGTQHLNNRWLSYVSTPLQALVVLWALTLWQSNAVARAAIRNSIPLVMIAVAVLSLFEDRMNFSRYTEPVLATVTLFVALYTVTARSTDEVHPLMRQDWFWICIGVAVKHGATAALTPFAAAFVRSEPELVGRAYQVMAMIYVAAMALLMTGMLCPTSPKFSGISSPLPQSA